MGSTVFAIFLLGALGDVLLDRLGVHCLICFQLPVTRIKLPANDQRQVIDYRPQQQSSRNLITQKC